jgi:hypothetical protein
MLYIDIAQLILILFSGCVLHVLVEVDSLCSLNGTGFGEELVLFKGQMRTISQQLQREIV